MDSDSDIILGAACSSGPSVDADSDVVVPLSPEVVGGDKAERGRQPSELTSSGFFGAWVVADDGAGGGAPKAIAFANLRWGVEVGGGDVDREHPAFVRSSASRGSGAVLWGHCRYTVDAAWTLDSSVDLRPGIRFAFH